MNLYYIFVLFISEYLIFLLIALFFILYYKNRDLLSYGISAFVFSALTTEGIKYFFPSPRPEESLIGEKEGGSFPSTHSSTAFAVAFTVFLKDKKKGTWFLIAAFFVSVGRFLAGVHYLRDIILGALIGIIWASVWQLFNIKVNLKS